MIVDTQVSPTSSTAEIIRERYNVVYDEVLQAVT